MTPTEALQAVLDAFDVWTDTDRLAPLHEAVANAREVLDAERVAAGAHVITDEELEAALLAAQELGADE